MLTRVTVKSIRPFKTKWVKTGVILALMFAHGVVSINKIHESLEV